jgi:hypothetical protein
MLDEYMVRCPTDREYHGKMKSVEPEISISSDIAVRFHQSAIDKLKDASCKGRNDESDSLGKRNDSCS